VSLMLSYYGCGVYFGKILCIIMVVQSMCLWLLDWWDPRGEIDPAGEIIGEEMSKVCQSIYTKGLLALIDAIPVGSKS
jgi:hypothetical protein